MKPQLLLVLYALPALAAAQVYKCEKDGKVTYTDRPCPASATASELPALLVTPRPSAHESALARQHDERLARDRAERDEMDAAWLKEHGRAKDREERVRKAIVEHRVIKGMTSGEVRQALGEPERIASGENFGTPKESWTYLVDGQTRTINFKDSQVTSTSLKRPSRRRGH